jgi:predicted PurR-regulated permease PerM
MDRLEFATRAFIAAGVLVLIVACVFLLWWSRLVFLLAFAGVVFGVFLHGLSQWLSASTKMPYYWSLGTVVLVLLSALGLTGWLLGAQISNQFSQLAQTLPEAFQRLQKELETYAWGEWLIERATDETGFANGQNVISRLTGIVGSVLSGIGGIVVIGFIGLYGAIEPGYYRAGLLHLLPPSERDRGNQVLDAMGENLRNWLVARIISMIIIGVLTSAGLWALNVPMYLALGLLAFFLVAIPNLGPVLAAIPALMVAWSQGGINLAGQTLALYIAIEGVESYVLLPLLQRETVYLPPILSIIVVVFFGFVGGILGALVASPLLVVLMILVKMLYVEDILDDYSVNTHQESAKS